MLEHLVATGIVRGVAGVAGALLPQKAVDYITDKNGVRSTDALIRSCERREKLGKRSKIMKRIFDVQDERARAKMKRQIGEEAYEELFGKSEQS